MFLRRNPVNDQPVALEAGEVEPSEVMEMDLSPSDLLDNREINFVISLTEVEKQLQARNWVSMNGQITDIALTPYEDPLMAIFNVGAGLDAVKMGKNCFLHSLRPDSESSDMNWSRRASSVYTPASSLPDNPVELCVKRPNFPLHGFSSLMVYNIIGEINNV